MLCKKKKQKKNVVGLFLRSRLKIGTLTIRRSGMLRSYKFGSRPFDTFATKYFFCLARSCRVVEKFDKSHRLCFIILPKLGVKSSFIGVNDAANIPVGFELSFMYVTFTIFFEILIIETFISVSLVLRFLVNFFSKICIDPVNNVIF